MSDKEPQGIVPMDDEVTSFLADEARLQTFRDASNTLSRFEVPRLVDPRNPHEKLYFAFFDGTGNDADKDPLHATNVDRIRKQLESLELTDKQIASHYVAGVGTQDDFLNSTVDLALGHTYEARLEEMHVDLTRKANAWFQEDPDVQIRVCSVGFSRGATQCAIFTNVLHERGIVDFDSRVVDADGRVSYTRHIASPGQTPQSVGLFDPVSTGVQELADRRLASSVVSGFQITALDEQRVKFISDRIMPMGLSEDGRFLNVPVAGAHSNIGGGYLRDGLSSRSFNLMSDYLNAQRPDAPMFEKMHAPNDPRLNVVHNSHEGMAIYQLDRKVSRSTPEGINTRLAPESPVVAGQLAVQESLPHGPKPFGPEITPGPKMQARVGPVSSQPGERAVANLERIATAEAAGIGPLTGEQKMASLARRFAGGAGIALGVGATAYDGAQTARRASELMEQGNPTAAQSEINHALARNAGGWVGGAAATYAVGASGFVPAAIVAGDALLMSKAFEHGADLVDNRKVFHQTDKAGVDWQFSGREWTRQGQLDRPGDGTDTAVHASFGASYEKSRELNAYANAAAVELALGKVPPPQDPFQLPAKDSERRLDNPNWRYDAAADQWQRSVKVGLTGANDTGVYEPQIATPERSAELKEQALQRIEGNIANGREAIAQTYLENAAVQRAQDFVGVPTAVEAARARPDTVMGSDNRLYHREQADQTVQWVRNDTGEVAQGDRALELELTRQVRQPALEQAGQTLAQLQAGPAPTPAQVEQNELLHRYRVVGTELNPDFQQAIALASERTRQAHGITGQGSVQLLHNETGQFGADSPIAHYQRGTDGVDHLVATTTTQEIRQTLAEVRQQHVAPATPTLATVSVVAPSMGHRQSPRASVLAQDDAARPDTPASSANAPSPAVSDTADQPDHALLQERQPERTSSRSQAPAAPTPTNPQASFTDPSHAGHDTYQRILREVRYMEAGQGIASGPHSEKVAAALLNESVANGLHINRVEMGADGQARGIQRFSAFDTPREISIAPRQAQGLSMQEHADKLEATLSSHLVSKDPAAERTPVQVQGMGAMSMADQIMFAHIRRGTPGHIGDDQVAQSMLGAKQNGIDDASKIGGITMAGDQLWIVGTGDAGHPAAGADGQPAVRTAVGHGPAAESGGSEWARWTDDGVSVADASRG